MKKSPLDLALIKYYPQMYPAIGNMNQLNSGKAVNLPAVPMKLAKIKSKIIFSKSTPSDKIPIIDITTAMTISFLFETSNFFRIPIAMNDKPVNANMSTLNSINPSRMMKASQLPKRAPERKWSMNHSNTFTKIPKRYNFTPLFTMVSHWLCLE